MKKIALVIVFTVGLMWFHGVASYSSVIEKEKTVIEVVKPSFKLYTLDFYVNGFHIQCVVMVHDITGETIGVWVYLNGHFIGGDAAW